MPAKGSFAYAAPEVVRALDMRASIRIDPAQDIWCGPPIKQCAFLCHI